MSIYEVNEKKKNHKFGVVIALVVSAAFLGFLAWGVLKKKPITGLSGATMVNRPAPDFTLKTFDGPMISMRALRGKPVVLNFWASWCPPCRIEASLLERTWRVYKRRGVAFIGIDLQDREEDALRFIREFNITYPNAPDLTGEVSISYGVSGLPVTFFVSREGQILRRWVGAIEKEVLVRSIKEIMQ